MPHLPSRKSDGHRAGERLAVNLIDLDRVPPDIRQMLLGGRLDLKGGAIKVGDEAAIGFSCDLVAACTICDVLRNHDRQAGDYPTRIYLNRGRGWSKLPGEVVLVEVVDGRCRLNPKVFPKALVVAKPIPLAARLVDFRKKG